MNKKGFTLIELLGVITLLVAVFLLAYPNIMEMLERGKKQDKEDFKNTVILATEAYINSSSEVNWPVDVGTSIEITYEKLIQSGYLSSSVINPYTSSTVGQESNKKITVKKDNSSKIVYTLEEEQNEENN